MSKDFIDDLEFDLQMASHDVEILQLRVQSMNRASRRDSSINLWSPDVEERENRRLNRLQRIASSLQLQLVVAQEVKTDLIQQIKQAKLGLAHVQTGGAPPDPELLKAYSDFRNAFARVQKAHVIVNNMLIRRDSGISSELVLDVREELANEIREAEHALEIAETKLVLLQ
jgi:hypothetical protein